MIHLPTVFVVGAGGSVPFDFPSGESLLRTARATSPDGLSADICNLYGPPQSVTFKETLFGCMEASLDAMLETRKDLEHIGKLYIARKILDAERDASLMVNVDGDWLAYLFQQVAETCPTLDDFEKVPIEFITYNYDRLIEFRLSAAFQAKYQAPSTRIAEYWRRRPIIHLHGSTGALYAPHRKAFVHFGGDADRSSDTFRDTLQRAAAAISIVHQADPNSEPFIAAREKLKAARTIVFLGFGFGEKNISRLDVKNISNNAAILCTAKDLEAGEISERVKGPFRFRIGREPTVCNPSYDSLRALRAHLDLLCRKS